MADIPNVLPYVGKLDFVSPLHAALELAQSRENNRTQRIFAENTMQRESAAEARAKQEHDERMEALKHQRDVETGTAFGTINDMLRQRDAAGRPINLGPAMALGHAYGIDVHPLLATTAAANAGPPPGDAVDQFLASQTSAAPSVSGEPGSPEAPPPVAGPSGGGVPPMVPMEGPEQTPEMEAARPFMVPGPSAAPPPPAAGAPSPDLERLMVSAAPPPRAPASPAAALPLLYEAVLNGQHYPLGGQGSNTLGLGEQYDERLAAYISAGIAPDKAKAMVIKDFDDDTKAQHIADRAAAGIEARNAEAEKLKGTYAETAEQRLAEAEKNRQNARAVAAIRGAGGEATPAQESGLAELLRMKQDGATDDQIALRAGALKIPEKAWRGAVKDVQTEAVSGNRAEERRANLEVDGRIATSPQAANKLRQQTQAWDQLRTRYQAAIDDVKEHGDRVITPGDIQRRNSLFAAAAAAARVYNGLGATDASQRLEAEILGARGTPGHGILMGANVGVLEHVMDEAAAQHASRIRTSTRPGGGKELPAAITHGKSPTGSGGMDLDALLRASENPASM